MNCLEEPHVEKRKDEIRRNLHSLSVRFELIKMNLETLADMLDEQGQYYFSERLKQIVEDMTTKH